MNEHTITVIFPARNEENNIEKSLKSILNQNVKPSKIIIVLDRCTDGTENIVTDFIIKHKEIEMVIKNNTKYPKTFMKGFLVAETINEGLKKIKQFPEFIMIPNSDSIY